MLPSEQAAFTLKQRPRLDQGVRFFDTANAYGPRTVNQIIGRALSPLGDNIVIGNKVGATRDGNGGWIVDNRPETLLSQVEDALFDMRAECSPLTYLRLSGDAPLGVDTPADGVPFEDALGALVELRDEGKIRHIGLSGASPEMLERAQKLTPIAAVQNRFNLVDRSGIEVLEACERQGIAFIPYWPLAFGQFGDLEPLAGPSERLGVPVSVVALAWLLRRSPMIVPIPGTKSLQHLDENISATIVAPLLTVGEVRALTEVEDEKSATLGKMPARMLNALTGLSRPGASVVDG